MITCTFENGNTAYLRHVTVKALTVNDNGQVLLIKRAAHIIRGGKYDIPGGFLDRDEDAKEGALRELKEETGITGKIEFLFRVNDSPTRPKEDRQNVDIIYAVHAVTGELRTDNESTSAAWFDREKLPSEEEFAFDHRESIIRYFEYLKKPFPLPIVG